MPQFDVHVFAEIRQKFEKVEADTNQAAVLKALETVEFRRWMDQFQYTPAGELAPAGEFSEGFAGFLVDVCGDTEYAKTQFFFDTGDKYVELAKKIIAWADDNNRSMATMLTLADELRKENLQTV